MTTTEETKNDFPKDVRSFLDRYQNAFTLENSMKFNMKEMKITEETKIKDILPEGYEVVKTHQNVESIVIEMKRKQKNFDQYAMTYQDNSVVVTLAMYLRERDVDAWPWEFRIGLFKYICEDLEYNWSHLLSMIASPGARFSKIYPKIVDICPEEFLKSLV